MNFTPELSAFQGAILSADNVHQFSRLSAIGGNENAIDFVVQSLSTFLEQGLYIVNGKVSSSKDSQVRKFALYLVLNADLPELQQLIDQEEISTLIWTTPTIPKCLMCELMWNLNMDKFISEIISYANPQLALEVASAFIENFKYVSPLDYIEQLQHLSWACYYLICRFYTFDFPLPELQNKLLLGIINLQQCLKYYTSPPNSHELNALQKTQVYKFLGYRLYSLLEVIEKCLKQFTSKLDVNPAGFEIYKLTFAENNLIPDHDISELCEVSNCFWLECMANAHTLLLDTCKLLVMEVSVDVFCCWSEIVVNDKSMQQSIGELCYKVHSKLITLSALEEHPLVSMIQQISRKPVEIKDKINVTEDAVIVQNINSNRESREWIKALLYKEKLYQNQELLNIVYTNIDIYDENECYKLWSSLKQYNISEAENKDLVELLAVKAFEKCDLSKKYSILEEHFNNKILVDMKETPQFKNTMTALFNKLIATPDADLTDILTVFLQNPQQVLLRVFKLASENTQQVQIMLNVMKLLERFSNHFYNTATEPCIVQITQRMFGLLETEAQENHFIQFVCGLKNMNIISGAKLLLLIIMTDIHKALLKTDIASLYLQLKLLKEAYNLQELMEYRAPMLAMLGQILDNVRWQINTFCSKSPATLNLAVDIQTALLQTYNGEIPDNQKQWLKSKLKNLKPLNMYYYRILWDPPGSNYLEVVSGITISNDMSLDNITAWLSQVVSSCTQTEWCEIWDSLLVLNNNIILNIIHTAVFLLTVAEKPNRTDKSAACMFNCYKNFVHVTRYKFFLEPITDEQVESVVRYMATIAKLLNEDNIEEFGTILMPILAFMTEKQTDYNMNLRECLHRHLGQTKLAPTINKIFHNGSA